MDIHLIANNNWIKILTALGFPREALNGKNQACPFCGGKDRWRFIDKDGCGNFVCNQCGKGDGFTLVQKWLKVNFGEAANQIRKIMGCPEFAERGMRDTRIGNVHERWEEGKSIEHGSPALGYLNARGIGYYRGNFPLRYHPGRDSILAAIIHRGEMVNLQEIVLNPDGDKRKLFMKGQRPNGSYVPLEKMYSSTHMLGVAEGIETAMAAHALYNVPVWACLSADSLAAFKAPDYIEVLYVFGDNDENYVGQAAAYRCAANNYYIKPHLPRKIAMYIPKEPGDWNDELLKNN